MKNLVQLGFAPCVAASLHLSAARLEKVASLIAAGLCPAAALAKTS